MDRKNFQLLIADVEALVAEKKMREARTLLEATSVPAQPGWHHVLARVCLELGDLEQAVQHGTKAVGLAPRNSNYRALLAACLYAASELQPLALDVAEIEATRALEIDPQTPTADNTLGLVFLAQGRRHEARKCFERAIKNAPSDPAAQSNLARCA